MSMITGSPQLTKLVAEAKRHLKRDSSTNTLIQRYRRSKELLHG